MINYWFGFNSEGNLQYREDRLKNQIQREDFLYDSHNRLTNWNVTGNGVVTPRLAKRLASSLLKASLLAGNVLRSKKKAVSVNRPETAVFERHE